MRIELHNARFRAHAELGFYQTWRTHDDPHRPDPGIRVCSTAGCGTRLRRSKSHYDRLCDACDAKKNENQGIRHTHPAEKTCACGAPMYRQSTRCRACYDRERFAPRMDAA